MKPSPNKLSSVDSASIDKSNSYVEVHSPSWKNPNKISIEELLKDARLYEHHKFDISKEIDCSTLIIDEKTLKVKINPLFQIAPSVFSSLYSNNDIIYSIPPKNASVLSGMHMMTDGNYLYVWAENCWKRVLLSSW